MVVRERGPTGSSWNEQTACRASDCQPLFFASKRVFFQRLWPLSILALAAAEIRARPSASHFAPLFGGGAAWVPFILAHLAAGRSSFHSRLACLRHPVTLFTGNFGRRCLPKDGRKLRIKLSDLFLNGKGLAELRHACQAARGVSKGISRAQHGRDWVNERDCLASGRD